jgi:hypothetical protein
MLEKIKKIENILSANVYEDTYKPLGFDECPPRKRIKL